MLPLKTIRTAEIKVVRILSLSSRFVFTAGLSRPWYIKNPGKHLKMLRRLLRRKSGFIFAPFSGRPPPSAAPAFLGDSGGVEHAEDRRHRLLRQPPRGRRRHDPRPPNTHLHAGKYRRVEFRFYNGRPLGMRSRSHLCFPLTLATGEPSL